MSTQVFTTRNIIFSVLLIIGACTLFLSNINVGYILKAEVISALDQRALQSCISNFSNEQVKNFKFRTEYLNDDTKKDVIVTFADSAHCGNAGCISEFCLANEEGTFDHVAFGFASKKIEVFDVLNNGMRDVKLGNQYTVLTWDGNTYKPSTD